MQLLKSHSVTKTRLFINNIDHLIEYVFISPADAERKRVWLKMINDYQEAMLILRKRSEYTESDIKHFS